MKFPRKMVAEVKRTAEELSVTPGKMLWIVAKWARKTQGNPLTTGRIDAHIHLYCDMQDMWKDLGWCEPGYSANIYCEGAVRELLVSIRNAAGRTQGNVSAATSLHFVGQALWEAWKVHQKELTW